MQRLTVQGTATRTRSADRARLALSPVLIAVLVGLFYFSSSLLIYRGVAASIPDILSGQAVLNGDEMVPFFNPMSQLIDQAAGKFNELTHGYEFRVRYSFLTTWMRYYKVLPFAIIIVIPGVTYVGYLAVSRFLAASLTAFSKPVIYVASAGPVAVIFLILAYSKITHFYTLILGFSLFLLASTLLLFGLIFAERRPYRYITAACLVTLLNPAIHYLILFALFLSLTVGGLVLLEIVAFARSGTVRRILGGWPRLPFVRRRSGGVRTMRPLIAPGRWLRAIGEQTRRGRARLADMLPGLLNATLTRCVLAFVILVVVTLIPYALFVKFIALRGVPNLSETVPGDFYFITDASISFGHLISWDMAGIMDKMIGGDYLAKQPRLANVAYTLLLLSPLFAPAIRRRVFDSHPRRQFLFVAYLNVFFSMWATLGYSDPQWMPTFHRVLAFVSQTANGTQSTVGDLVVKLTSTIVQVLRFPHRFQLILFMMGCILLPISVAWIGQWVYERTRAIAPATSWTVWPLALVLFFTPLFSNRVYREVFFSGDYRDFLAPYPVSPLQDVKQLLEQLPPGKVVVLPPTETAKIIVDIHGVEHKFIDKFHIYYLDLPSFYYGLTGDSDNKYEFFLLLRALYYQQNWWINIARDLNIRYIVVNKELVGNTVGGAEYLREIEKIILPEMDSMTDYLRKLYDNDSYAVYELTDLPRAERMPLLIDSDWNTFIQVLSSRLDLTRYYDLRHTVVSDDLTDYDNLAVITDDLKAASLDLYLKAHPSQFVGPSSSMFAFSPAVIPSSYYLSPMFRLFQFFSDSKWNRLNMITPGLFGTIKGSFVGLPRATEFRIDARFPEDGAYRLLLRGAATKNRIDAKATSLGYATTLELEAAPGNLAFFDQETVFSPERTPIDIGQYSIDELARLIPEEIVAVNFRYQFFDMGMVNASAGTHTFYLDKQDDNPLLVEGILTIPEDVYQSLTLPDNAHWVDSVEDLCCAPLGNQE